MDKRRIQEQRILIVIAILVVSAPILIYLYGAQFVRYMADDFCIGNTAWLNSMLSGQLMFPIAGLIDYPIHIAGQAWAPLFTILCIIFWWIGMFLVLREILHRPLLAALGASLLISATLASTTNVYQSVFWQEGMRENLMPIIFATYLVWLILQRTIHPMLSLLLCFIFAFLTSGVNFVFGAGLAVMSGIIWLVLRKQATINHRILISAIGAGLVVVLIMFAPGTSSRIEEEKTNPFIRADPQTISRLLNGLQRGFKDPLIYTLKNGPLAWAAVLILPFLAGQYGISGITTSTFTAELQAKPRKRLLTTLVALGLPTLAIFSCMLMWAGGYVSEGKLAVRLWISGQYFVLVSSAAAAYILGFVFAATFPSRLALVRRYSTAIVAILLVATVFNVVAKAIPVVNNLNTYSVLADQRDAQLRLGILTVPELSSFNLNDLGVPWFDQCLQTYYNLPATPIALR